MVQLHPHHTKQDLPTMYDLPSEYPEELGLPDEFHGTQPIVLKQTCQSPRYPREDYFIATDMNVYYDLEHPLWHKRPDWFLVLGARASTTQQNSRLSYVIWQEEISPYLVVELLSPGTEDEDLGRTVRQPEHPPTKWEVYEQILQVPYYVVYDRYTNNFRAFALQSGQYEELQLEDDRLWLEELGLGLGVWQGSYEGVEGRWLRFYDTEGNWVATPEELAEQAQQQAKQAQQQAKQAQQQAEQAQQETEEERQKNQKMRDRLLQLGIDPDSL